MADKPQTLRDTDDEARRLARVLVRGARFMALAVNDPEDGYPSASRVLTGTDADAAPVILVSGLSTHTTALAADPRCSLLAGEPGKGDPLAHPRISVQSDAEKVARDGPDHLRIRSRFLHRHPKAQLYVDFPDFCFFRLVPRKASLNGGFGRAYQLKGSDLLIPEPGITSEWVQLQNALENMKEGAACLAAKIGAKIDADWRFGGADRAGLDIIGGDFQLRHEFETLLPSPQSVLDYISSMAYQTGQLPEI
ncbi:HugZ family protein [Rhizobium deserti]|uniref:HugZ family protein n=1 Tax=Rhizobium deserti TaxID=2547961 RepID=A0A4R5UMH4_9HYPH|nr:pyridoxamine 5'-phosphate oxidase family protein [Rhizobium deserti]TDK39066.1 HugZ family protein [Rhizobium deserti]